MFHQRAESPLRLNGLEQARRFFAGCMAGTDPAREYLCDSADLPIRDIIADAARHGSRGLILAHNHPSGDPSPSAADKRITRRLALVGEAMDVAILDHLVLAGSQCRSMRQMGLL